MNGIREFLESSAGRIVGILLAVVAVGVMAWVVVGQFGNAAAAQSANRMFVDAETGEAFSHELTLGEKQPVETPAGTMTGYEAEPCYWTADGGAKETPTWVLPKVKVDPASGPTFCPDCGRLVTPRNPQPGEGVKPPPTQAQYEQRQTGGKPPQADADRDARPDAAAGSSAPAAPRDDRRR